MGIFSSKKTNQSDSFAGIAESKTNVSQEINEINDKNSQNSEKSGKRKCKFFVIILIITALIIAAVITTIIVILKKKKKKNNKIMIQLFKIHQVIFFKLQF